MASFGPFAPHSRQITMPLHHSYLVNDAEISVKKTKKMLHGLIKTFDEMNDNSAKLQLKSTLQMNWWDAGMVISLG